MEEATIKEHQITAWDLHAGQASPLMKIIQRQAINLLACHQPDRQALRQYTSPQIISWDPISLGFLVYIDAVCRL